MQHLFKHYPKIEGALGVFPPLKKKKKVAGIQILFVLWKTINKLAEHRQDQHLRITDNQLIFI